MSLINQMLKDLEQRRADKAQSTHHLLQGLGAVFHSTPKRKWFYYLLIAVLLFIIIIPIIYISSQPKAPTQPIAVPVSNDVAPQPPAAVVAATTPQPTIAQPANLTTLVQAIHVAGDANNTELKILLNKKIHYSANLDPSSNTLTVLLDNSQMAEPLLPLNTHNTLIKSVQVANIGNQLKMTLELMPNAQLTGMQQMTEPAVSLTVNLHNNQSNDTTINTKNTSGTVDPITVNKKALHATGLTDEDLADGPTNTVQKEPIEKNPDDLYQQAVDAIQNNDPANAVNILQQILLQTPDYTPARIALSTLYLQKNQIADAETVIKEGLSYDSQNPDLTKAAAQIALAQNKPQNALMILKTVNPEMTSYPDYYSLEAALYQRIGRPQQAAEIYNQLVTISQNNSIWWLGLATALDSLNKSKSALSAYENASAIGGFSPQVQSFINGRIQALRGN